MSPELRECLFIQILLCTSLPLSFINSQQGIYRSLFLLYQAEN